MKSVDILPPSHAFTGIIPGLGLLRDLYTVPYLGRDAPAPGRGGGRGPGRRSDGRFSPAPP